MTLFDGGRWDRIRRSAYGGRRSWWRLTVGGWWNTYAVPLPHPFVVFEECSLTVGVRLADALNDPVVAVELSVELPGVLADLLVLVWPRIERRERWLALRRLLAGSPEEQ